MAFDTDFKAYEQALPSLLQRYNEGDFALFHECQVEEVFATQNEAMDAGYARHGVGHFFVKKILRTDLDDPESCPASP